jgi:hypothetical protein
MSIQADVLKSVLTYRDVKGQTARFSFYENVAASTGTPIDDALTLLDAVMIAVGGAGGVGGGQTNSMTNAALQAISGVNGVGQISPTYGLQLVSTVGYQECVDKAVFVFSTQGGTIHRYEIPAPVGGIFESDLQTVNPTAGSGGTPHLVAAFTAAMLATVNGSFISDRNGNQLTQFLGGYWRGRKIPKRMNILLRTPALTPDLPVL